MDSEVNAITSGTCPYLNTYTVRIITARGSSSELERKTSVSKHRPHRNELEQGRSWAVKREERMDPSAQSLCRTSKLC